MLRKKQTAPGKDKGFKQDTVNHANNFAKNTIF
jgi:hypothetical protein